MKKTFLTLVFVCIAYCSFAQWTTSGTNISNTNTGNVGIGTASPSNNLQIGTSIGVSSSSPVTLSIGGTFSSTHGINPKLKVYDDGTNFWGLGSSSSQLDYIVNGGAYDHVFYAGGTELMRIKGSGNIGIGTTNPTYLLDANGIIHSSVTSGSNLIISKNTGASVSFDNGTGIQTSLIEAGTNDNHLEFWTNTATNTGLVERMRVTNTGSLCIGTTNPGNYRLAVNGGIHSQSVNVDLTGWSDYVFKQDYKLASLTEVKSYIDQNQHLPDMPSEQEVVKDGINLGEMNKLLTKKVEELTLYLIEKDKAEKEANEKIKNLQSQLNTLSRRLDQLAHK
jgi:hypothetical protein